MKTFLISIGIPLLYPLVKLLQWSYKRIRNSEITHSFVADMATNHLPHIYHVLQLICAERGIEVTEPPPIRYIQLNGKDDHDSGRD